MNLDEIRELIALMKENQIAEIDLEHEGGRLRLVANQAPASPAIGPPLIQAPEFHGQLPAPSTSDESEIEETSTVNSPIVGTFYRASSPDADSFVDIGDEVEVGSVLCIVEAMKVMNEIKAEMKGNIQEILVENGEAVQYGQPLFRIQPQT